MTKKTNKLNVKSVLFVCTGNTCRSPMAEWIMREKAAEKGLELVVESRGISASSTSHGKKFLEITADAARAVRELYPDSAVWTHSPKQLTAKDVSKFDLILTMEEAQRGDILDELVEFCPELKKKVFAVREYAGLDDGKSKELNISDPLGGGYYSSTYYGSSASYEMGGDSEAEEQLFAQQDSARARATGKIHQAVFPQSRKSEKVSKVGKDYLRVREQLVKCIEVILDGKEIPYDEIIKRRKARSKSSNSSFSRGSSSDEWTNKSEAKAKQSAAVENRELYGDALDVLNDAPEGARVEVPWIVMDGVDDRLTEQERSYLGKKAGQLKDIIKQKRLTVIGTMQKLSSIMNDEPIEVRRDPGVASDLNVLSPKKVNMFQNALEVIRAAPDGAEIVMPYDVYNAIKATDKESAPRSHVLSMKVSEIRAYVQQKELKLSNYAGSETKSFNEHAPTPGKRGNRRGLKNSPNVETVVDENSKEFSEQIHQALSVIRRAKRGSEIETPYEIFTLLNERNDASREPAIFDMVVEMKGYVAEKSLGIGCYEGKGTKEYERGKMPNPPRWVGTPVLTGSLGGQGP